jgi:hypothetical protein
LSYRVGYGKPESRAGVKHRRALFWRARFERVRCINTCRCLYVVALARGPENHADFAAKVRKNCEKASSGKDNSADLPCEEAEQEAGVAARSALDRLTVAAHFRSVISGLRKCVSEILNPCYPIRGSIGSGALPRIQPIRLARKITSPRKIGRAPRR